MVDWIMHVADMHGIVLNVNLVWVQRNVMVWEFYVSIIFDG